MSLTSAYALLLFVTLSAAIVVGLVGVFLRFVSTRTRLRGEWLMATGAKIMLWFLAGAFLFALVARPDVARQDALLQITFVVALALLISMWWRARKAREVEKRATTNGDGGQQLAQEEPTRNGN